MCGNGMNLEKHHLLHGSANRKKAEEDGCWVYLCNPCHHRVHCVDKKLDHKLEELTQIKWEETYGKTTEEFIKRYGKNYKTT